MSDIEATEAYRGIVKAMLPMVPLTITFTYVDGNGDVSERHVEPYEIRGDRLFAHCLDRDALRQFKIGRMSNVLPGEKFTPRHAVKLPV